MPGQNATSKAHERDLGIFVHLKEYTADTKDLRGNTYPRQVPYLEA